MPAVEKQAARALSQGQLKHDPLTTTGADVVGAMAFTSKLGGLLWRCKWGKDKSALKPTALLLARKVWRQGESFAYIAKIAAIALDEHLDPLCTHCKGRGHVTNSYKVVSICTHCHGTGIARVNDQRRIRLLGCTEHDYRQKWEDRMSQAHSVLSSCDSDTATKMRKQLRKD